jgi:hypothetical protein
VRSPGNYRIKYAYKGNANRRHRGGQAEAMIHPQG